MISLARVWPLRPGLKGVAKDGVTEVDLYPGKYGFVELNKAKEMEKRGDLQLMVGISPMQLKKPIYETRVQAPQPRRIAEAPEDLDSVRDEEPENPEPPSPPTPPAVPRKKVVAKKRYSRRDMKAESP